MKGKFIVLDGNDGSGKATQAKLLVEHLKKQNVSVQTIDFPRYYDNFFGKLVGECLRGDYGDFLGMHPKITSVLYAADRFESAQHIREWLSKGVYVVADRYATANMIHQGGKIEDEKERNDYLEWLHQMEFEIFKIPKPDTVLYLDISVEQSLKNLEKKNDKYAKGKKDQHEGSEMFLSRSRAAAHWLVERYQNWTKIDCMKSGKMKTREDILEEIVKLISY